MEEIGPLVKQGKIWNVLKKNWSGNSVVQMWLQNYRKR
jgi:type II secretory pathway component PulL